MDSHSHLTHTPQTQVELTTLPALNDGHSGVIAKHHHVSPIHARRDGTNSFIHFLRREGVMGFDGGESGTDIIRLLDRCLRWFLLSTRSLARARLSTLAVFFDHIKVPHVKFSRDTAHVENRVLVWLLEETETHKEDFGLWGRKTQQPFESPSKGRARVLPTIDCRSVLFCWWRITGIEPGYRPENDCVFDRSPRDDIITMELDAVSRESSAGSIPNRLHNV